MDAGRPSTTSLMVAFSRDAHRVCDECPWILDDPYARGLVGPAWDDVDVSAAAAFPEPARRQIRAAVVVRSRYAEDRLVGGSYRQYVMLGAGLDSFAWRRPDLVGPLRVVEVDHPATQAWKRARIDDLGLPVRGGHLFAPVDLKTDTLRSGLDGAGLDWSQPTFFSSLGVIMYLTIAAIEAILRTVAACAPHSEIVLSYDDSNPVLDETGHAFADTESNLVASVGEPYTTKFSPAEADALVRRCGLEVAEHPAPEALYDRYFSDRHDGLRPSTVERLIAARVPS
jgi:methyltransferase (TIGR00027 family)